MPKNLKIMIRTLIIGLFLVLNACIKDQNNHSDSDEDNNYQATPGLFVGQKKIDGNEIVFLALERINSSNRNFWDKYREHSFNLAKSFKNITHQIDHGERNLCSYGAHKVKPNNLYSAWF